MFLFITLLNISTDEIFRFIEFGHDQIVSEVAMEIGLRCTFDRYVFNGTTAV